jgi:hypothetical protein
MLKLVRKRALLPVLTEKHAADVLATTFKASSS